MKQKLILYTLLALFFAVPATSFAQYFQGIFDNDSTNDWGWCILNRPDNNYFVLGWSLDQGTGYYSTFNMIISNDGSTVISKKDIEIDGTSAVGPGNAGEIRQLPDGGYLSPLEIQWTDSTSRHVYSSSGFIKYDVLGDTVFLRTYTDTSIYFDILGACAIMPDGGFIGGGGRGLNVPSIYPGLIIRTDSLGDTLWTHTYQFDTAQWVSIDNIIPLSDGRIVAGAQSTYYNWDDGSAYTHNAPWFMVLDGMGNIIRDTVYGSEYAGGGFIYKDINGGYVHLGQIDTFETIFPLDYQNFPNYIAHLDTNFRMDWITRFSFDGYYGHRYSLKAIQLMDGNFLVEGDAGDTTYSGALAWAAKIDRGGNILWEQYYVSDSSQEAYFRDVTELPNGNLVFVGATFNDTLPAWHERQDVWIVGTDSNGCVLPGGCNPLTDDGVKQAMAAAERFSIYPNPAADVANVSWQGAGLAAQINVSDITGRQVYSGLVAPGARQAALRVSGFMPGVYTVKLTYVDGHVDVGKMVKE